VGDKLPPLPFPGTAVAAALGHESFKTTAESYAKRHAVASAQQNRVLGVLTGGTETHLLNGPNRSQDTP
jgi:hypothetical protein